MYVNRSNAVNTIYKIDCLRSSNNATVSFLLTDRLVDVNTYSLMNALLVLMQKIISIEIAHKTSITTELKVIGHANNSYSAKK